MAAVMVDDRRPITSAMRSAGWTIAGEPSGADPRDESCSGSGQLLTLADLLGVAACPACGGVFAVEPTDAGPALRSHLPAIRPDPDAPSFGL